MSIVPIEVALVVGRTHVRSFVRTCPSLGNRFRVIDDKGRIREPGAISDRSEGAGWMVGFIGESCMYVVCLPVAPL